MDVPSTEALDSVLFHGLQEPVAKGFLVVGFVAGQFQVLCYTVGSLMTAYMAGYTLYVGLMV